MMNPYERFLGVDDSSNPLALLDLTADELTTLQIESALRTRLAAVYNHPDGRSDEAETVRQALRRAADELKNASARSRSIAPAERLGGSRSSAAPVETLFHLTPFDREVLAVLVGSGGWNAQSRARLVAVSATYGVSVAGLMRVVQGLGEYARSGGPRLAFSDITPTRKFAQLAAIADSPSMPVGPAFIDRAAEGLAIELRRGGPWITIKLAVIFGIATIIASIIALRILLAGGEQQAKELAKEAPPAANTGSNAVATRPVARHREKGPRIAQFAKEPNFLGNGMPPEAVSAVDELAHLPQLFDELARKLIVEDDPSEAVFHNWDLALKTLASGWTLADSSSRKEVEGAMFETLRAASDTPSVSDRLLKSLLPPASVSAPIELWRGAWMAGMLGDISSTDVLPPVVVQRARTQAELALGTKPVSELNFERGARLWLDQQLPQLVASMEFDSQTYDSWELWLAAQRVLGINQGYDAALMGALEKILRTDTDLSRPGPSTNIVGRLLRHALARSNQFTKTRMLSLFDVEQISARDLWVLTSLLSNSDAATWFPDELVMPDEADQAHRWRVRDDLAKRWPVDDESEQVNAPKTATALIVNEQIGGNWVALAEGMLREQIGKTPEDLIWQLVRSHRLFEAAIALEVHNDSEAEMLLTEFQEMVQPRYSASPNAPSNPTSQPEGWPAEDFEKIKPPDPGMPTGRSPIRGQPHVPAPVAPAGPVVGQSLGRDGDWTLLYNQAGRNVEARLELLRQLGANAGTDLGPIDSNRFVEELYRGTPQEIRSLAQQVAQKQFSTGPNIAMELVNQFADVTPSDGLSQFIQDFSGQSLPAIREVNWRAGARLALVQHALSLRTAIGSDIEAMMELLIDSQVRQFMLLRNEQVASIAPSTVQETARLLAKAWYERASLASVSKAFPGDLPTLQRRQSMRMKLASGPIQIYLAQQLNVLDLLCYVTAGERPTARDKLFDAFRRSSERRSHAPGSLEQAVEAQRAMLAIWIIRMDLAPVPTTQPANGGKP